MDNDSGDTGWFEKNLSDVMINELERDDVIVSRRAVAISRRHGSHRRVTTTEGFDTEPPL